MSYLDPLIVAQLGSFCFSGIFEAFLLSGAIGTEFFSAFSAGQLAPCRLEIAWPSLSRSQALLVFGMVAPPVRKSYWSFLEACLATASLAQFEQQLVPKLQQVLGQEMAAGGVAVFADLQALHVANFTFPGAFIQRGLQGSYYRSPLSQAWRQSCRPQYFDLTRVKGQLPESWGIYRDFGIKNVLGHGVPDIQGGCASFFGFAQVPEKLCAHHEQLMELLVPHLHLAFLRSLQAAGKLISQPSASSLNAPEPAKAKSRRLPATPPDQTPISPREREILHWMLAGKSNWEIGMILRISEWTVKNHVQHILKKLQASNRSHAVAKALSMGLLDP